MQTDVSVIIINYNTFDLTCRCIQSIYDKTQGLTYEVILVDNSSNERNAEDFLTYFPGIRLIKSELNLGFAGGNNLGIKEATGDCILLLNSDAWLKNNAIKISFEKLKLLPQIGALTCKLLYPDERVQPVAGRFPSLERELNEFLRLRRRLDQLQRAKLFLGTEFDYETEMEVDWIWGAFFMFPKKILRDFPNHLLSGDYFMYMEDVLWCYEIRKAGYIVYYIPEGEVYHLMAGSRKEKVLSEFDLYSKNILPNEYKFIKRNKGFLYTKFYYLIKALHHLSLRTKLDRVKSGTFFSYVFK